jgi:DNA repair exonuclease SbcCD ATPase subunit
VGKVLTENTLRKARNMARPKMSEEDKAKKASTKDTPEGITESLERLEKKLAETKLKKAVVDNPGLGDIIAKIGSATQEVVNYDNALSQGSEVNLEKKRNAISARIANLKNQITQLEAELASNDANTLIESLKANRSTAVKQLKTVIGNVIGQFNSAGVDPYAVIPDLAKYRAEIIDA